MDSGTGPPDLACVDRRRKGQSCAAAGAGCGARCAGTLSLAAGSAGGNEIFSGGPVAPDAWQRLLLRRSGERMELFINGDLRGSTAVGEPVRSDFYLLVGRLYRNSNQRAFDGVLRDFRFFSRAVEPGASRRISAPLQVSMAAMEGGGSLHLRETVAVECGKVTITQEVLSGSVEALTVNYPFVSFDGERYTDIQLDGPEATLLLDGQGVTVRLTEPKAAFEHLPLGLEQENGDMDLLGAKVSGTRAVFTVTPAGEAGK